MDWSDRWHRWLDDLPGEFDTLEEWEDEREERKKERREEIRTMGRRKRRRLRKAEEEDYTDRIERNWEREDVLEGWDLEKPETPKSRGDGYAF